MVHGNTLISFPKNQLSTVNCQLSTVNCQLSTVNCQLSTVNCQLSTVNCQLSTVNCQLSTVNCQLFSNIRPNRMLSQLYRIFIIFSPCFGETGSIIKNKRRIKNE